MEAQTAAQMTEPEKVRQARTVVQITYEAVWKEIGAAKEIEALHCHGEFVRRQIDSVAREQNGQMNQKQGEVQKKKSREIVFELDKNQSHNIDYEVGIIKNHIQESQHKIFAVENDGQHHSMKFSSSTRNGFTCRTH
jgi:hypothetical protein